VYAIQNNFWPTFSVPNFRDLSARTKTLSAMAGYAVVPMAISPDQRAERIWGFLVTGNYFDLLGVRPALGRFFTAAEDREVGAAPVMVLSHSTWRRWFGADSAVVGRTMPVNGRPYTVIGVAPEGFFGTEVVLRAEVFVPLAMQPDVMGRTWLESRDTWNLFTLGRLAPGVAIEAVRAEMGPIAAGLASEYPDDNKGLVITLSRPGLFGDTGRRPVAAFAAAVQALAILVLLAACANLASLFTARVSDRAGELAVRMSIGAGRGRVVRQLVTETVALALLGGGGGWLLASWLLPRLSAWRPAGTPTLIQVDVTPDWGVFLVAFAAALLAGLLSALAPARAAWRVDLAGIIKGAPTRAGGPARSGLREGLLVTQVTLAAVLVTVCLVAVRGLERSLQMPTGIRTEGVAVIGFDPTFTRRPAAEGHLLQRRALERVAGLPGVTSAGFGSGVPLSIYQSHVLAYRDDAVDFQGNSATLMTEYAVSPGYLGVLGTSLTAGRDFAWTDTEDAPRVAIVNRRFAEVLLRPGDPVGQRFRTGPDTHIEVIGVVEDGKYESLAEARRVVVFWSALQQRPEQTLVLARTDGSPELLAAEMRRTVEELDRTVPLTDIGPLETLTDYALMPARIAAIALSGFGLLALMLAVTGIHGMAAYAVSRRTREIGLRMALGAGPAMIVRQVLGRIAALVAAGSALGVGLALGLSRLLGNVVFQASPREPIVLLGTAAAMVVVAVLAAAAPARRATSAEPLRSLRA
jgi:predicted permease